MNYKKKEAPIDMGSVTSIVDSLENHLSEAQRKKLLYKLNKRINFPEQITKIYLATETSKGKIVASFLLVTFLLLLGLTHLYSGRLLNFSFWSEEVNVSSVVPASSIYPTENTPKEVSIKELLVMKPGSDLSDNKRVSQMIVSRLRNETEKLSVLQKQLKNEELQLKKIASLIESENDKYDVVINEKEKLQKKIEEMDKRLNYKNTEIKELEKSKEDLEEGLNDLVGYKKNIASKKLITLDKKIKIKYEELTDWNNKKAELIHKLKEIDTRPEEIDSYIHVLGKQKKELQQNMPIHSKQLEETKNNIQSLNGVLIQFEANKKKLSYR